MRTATSDISDEGLRRTIMVPLLNCKAEPIAAVHVPKLEELRLGWDATFALKLALDDKAYEAQVRVNHAGLGLSRAASSVSKAILTITDDNREDDLYKAYFGDKTLGRFKRRFGFKLTAMRGWIKPLKASPHPSLNALADAVEQAVKTAGDAVVTRDGMRAEKRHFRDEGERKMLIEKTNATCKAIHGELGKLAHEIPGLPADFADRFFFSESRDDDDDDAEEANGASPTEAAKAKIASLKEELAAAEQHLKEVEAAEAKAAAAAAALAAEKAALAALEAEAAEKAAQAAALKAKLEKKQKSA